MARPTVNLGSGEFNGISTQEPLASGVPKVGGSLGGIVCKGVCVDCRATYAILDEIALPRDEEQRPFVNFSEGTGQMVREAVKELDAGWQVAIDGSKCSGSRTERALLPSAGAFVCGATVSYLPPQESVPGAESHVEA